MSKFSLSIEPTNACNLNCSICYARTSKRKQGMMSLDLYKKIIDEAVTLGISDIGLNYGGEPTMHPGFSGMIKYAADKGINIQFSTNGILLTDDIIDAITSSEHVRLINISLHSDFDTVEKNLEKRSDLPRLTATINLGEFDSNTIETLKHRFRGIVRKIGIQPKITNMQWSQLSTGSKVNHQRYCRHSQRYMVVLWDGHVTICCHDIGGEMAFGDVASIGLAGTWNSKYFVELRNALLINKPPHWSLCERCGVRHRIMQK